MFNRETWQGAQAEAQQPPVVEEPQAAPQQDATGDAPVSPTEVHDEPGISQQQGNVEDAAPQAAPQEEEQGLTDEVSGIELGEPDFTHNGGDAGWESQSGEEWLGETPWGTPLGDAGWDSQLGEEWLEEISPTVSEEKDLWDFPFSDMPEEPTPGGYDGLGIAGGLGIDYDDTDFGDESEECSPDVTSEQEEASEAQSEAQSNFTDAEYQEVLDDLDHGNIEDVREFLEDLAHGGNDDTEEAPQYAPGDPEDGKLVDEGISIGDIVGGEEKNVEEGLEDANNTEEYTYDEDAYEDAEDALEDLQDALQDGDEEDLAEALEELQGYLGGFDKGEPKEDEENAPHNHGGSEEVANGVDKEAVEAPDASGAAVSGPALGGAAVGAGAVAGEAGGLDEDLVKEVQDFFGDMFGGGEAPAGAGAAAGAGAVGEAIDGATQQAGGAIDGALGIEGSGKVLDQVANGDFEEAYDGVVDYGADKAGDWIGEQLGSEELGDTASEVLNHVANGDFEEALDTAVEGIGDAAEDLWDSIWD